MAPHPLYQDTIEYLFALQKHGIKLGLSNSVQILDRLGNPHRKFRTVHVAGTNGKGSTSVFIAEMLRAAGYRVGLYTSPHLVDFSERIRVNNVPVPEAEVVELAQQVREECRRTAAADGSGPIQPTFFEVTTAIAFLYFARQGVDIAVVEVGMGGRCDSTNVISPLVSVITNIDIEHTEFLGDTLERIAGEKAGIIKQGAPVVTGAAQQEVLAVFEREAGVKGTRVLRLGREFAVSAESSSGDGQVFTYRGTVAHYSALRIRLLGRHQLENAGLALAAVECLRGAGVAVDEAAVRSGLAQARWEGRLERMSAKSRYLSGRRPQPRVCAQARCGCAGTHARLPEAYPDHRDPGRQGLSGNRARARSPCSDGRGNQAPLCTGAGCRVALH